MIACICGTQCNHSVHGNIWNEQSRVIHIAVHHFVHLSFLCGADIQNHSFGYVSVYRTSLLTMFVVTLPSVFLRTPPLPSAMSFLSLICYVMSTQLLKSGSRVLGHPSWEGSTSRLQEGPLPLTSKSCYSAQWVDIPRTRILKK